MFGCKSVLARPVTLGTGMARLGRMARLTRRGSRTTVPRVPVLAGERVSSLADPRLWPNAVEIASGLGRPESTVRDALAHFLRLSRTVGRERHYPWTVAFELARVYAVPLDEVTGWAHAFLETVAHEREVDPRDLFDLYATVLAQWRKSAEQPTPSTKPTRHAMRRLDPDVVRAERALQDTEDEFRAPPSGPTSVSRAEWEQAKASSA